MKLPKRDIDELTYCWMLEYFKLCGDPQPNEAGYSHIEEGHTKKDVYNDYLAVFTSHNLKAVDISRFRYIWRTCTPHVLVRKAKGVDSKCPTCCMLTRMWEETTDKRTRAYIIDLRQRHRITYMGERQGYWSRRLDAVMNPKQVCSTIGDGMQQSHCCCPHQGHSGQQLVGHPLKVYLQGVISHGRSQFYMFRHFGNLGKGGTNVAVHSWLRALELEMEHNNGKLPDTVYHQVDGGPENANLVTIAIAEILVHRGYTKKVVLTRLPVGHTHEDIDARFGVSSYTCIN